jgi:hypothetical protein
MAPGALAKIGIADEALTSAKAAAHKPTTATKTRERAANCSLPSLWAAP